MTSVVCVLAAAVVLAYFISASGADAGVRPAGAVTSHTANVSISGTPSYTTTKGISSFVRQTTATAPVTMDNVSPQGFHTTAASPPKSGTEKPMVEKAKVTTAATVINAGAEVIAAEPAIVESLVSQVNPSRMERRLKKLIGFGVRSNTYPADDTYQKAASFMKRKLENLGLKTYQQNFRFGYEYLSYTSNGFREIDKAVSENMPDSCNS